MDLAVSLLLSSVMASLENKIAKIHSENFSMYYDFLVLNFHANFFCLLP